jgi:hypothetical protein
MISKLWCIITRNSCIVGQHIGAIKTLFSEKNALIEKNYKCMNYGLICIKEKYTCCHLKKTSIHIDENTYIKPFHLIGVSLSIFLWAINLFFVVCLYIYLLTLT